jgi:hypothetical protein
MMTIVTRFRTTVAVIGLLAGLAQTTKADVVTYTSSAAFNAAITGINSSIENYSGFAALTPINAGNTFDGLTYSAFTSGPSGTLLGGIITTQFNSFTGKSLGGRQSGGAQFFFGGDSVTVTFAAPVNAFGLFFNANLNSGNYGFNTSVGSATTGSATYDTSTFVFAGLVSSTKFTSATFFSTNPTLGVYNIPEIITAVVPEPSTWVTGLLVSMTGLCGGVAARLRRVAR